MKINSLIKSVSVISFLMSASLFFYPPMIGTAYADGSCTAKCTKSGGSCTCSGSHCNCSDGSFTATCHCDDGACDITVNCAC